MNVLITGSSGFIGRNLTESLKDRYSIYSPGHKELDITDYESVEAYIKRHEIKTVIHAAVGGGDILETTLRMFLSLIRNIDRVDKIIHFGSGAEYDKTRDLVKVKESDWGKRIPVDQYGLAKFICSEISKNYKKIVTLRLFGVYGKYEDYRYKFISNTIAKVLMNLPVIIKQDVVFDYLYIDDLISIVEHFITHSPPYSFYNVTPTRSVKLSQICEYLKKVSKKNFDVKIANRGLNRQYTGSCARLLKFIPKFKFTQYEQCISYLFNFYRKNIKKINKKELIQDEYFRKTKIKTF